MRIVQVGKLWQLLERQVAKPLLLGNNKANKGKVLTAAGVADLSVAIAGALNKEGAVVLESLAEVLVRREAMDAANLKGSAAAIGGDRRHAQVGRPGQGHAGRWTRLLPGELAEGRGNHDGRPGETGRSLLQLSMWLAG